MQRKISCRFNDEFDALAHLIVDDDGEWRGEADMLCSPQQFQDLDGKTVLIRFEDGRNGTAKILGMRFGSEGSDIWLCEFKGLSPLA